MKRMLLLLAMTAMLLPVSAKKKDNWSPAGDHLLTPWAALVNPESPLGEDPRPQLTRPDWQSLNGLWDYAIVSKTSSKPASADGKILVPFAVESALSGVCKTVTPDDAIWYETEFKVPGKWKKQRIMLNFEAVDWQTEVWVNDNKVGTHTGGFTHFSFDITPYLKGGKEKLTVKVTDATDNDFQPRGKQVLKPSGIWYTAVSGIWQSVWLEPVPESHIVGYEAVADIDKETCSVTVNTVGTLPGDKVVFSLYEDEHKFYTETADPNKAATVTVPSMKLWSPDDPHLYKIYFRIVRGNEIIDEAEGYTAMRKISVMEDKYGRKRLALNNKPLFQFGPLDQGWWPDGLYTAPTDEALMFDIAKTKNFGFNMIRKHIKIEPSRWYYYCDKLGMLVWQDMPSFGESNVWAPRCYGSGKDFEATQAAKDNYYKEWEEIMSQLKCFQSIVVWVPFNEAWSQFDTKDVVEFTREKDPTRLINQASGGNWVADCGDILDVHHYPEPKMTFWDFDKVNVIGEYGGIGYPVEGHLWQPDKNWGYVKYQSSEDVLKEYESFAEKLKKEIRLGCSAAVYTQTTDVEIEVNGIMTYDRVIVKMDEPKLLRINQSVIKSMEE